MVSRYKLGYYYERKTVQRLRKAGWDAWRTPASKTAIDVVAIKPSHNGLLVKLIQVKSTSSDKFDFFNLSREERGKLFELAVRYKDYDNVSIELWIYYRKRKKVKVFNVKKAVHSRII